MPALAFALALLAFFPAAEAAQFPIVDTVEIAPGAFYQEAVYPPSDGSPWSVRAEAINGTGPFDLYILPSAALINDYPYGDFAAMVDREDTHLATADFHAPSRLQGYTLIIDNLNNGHPDDALPAGNLTVVLTRTPPLRSNPEAQAALSIGATVCTAVLAVAAVAVAIYLKRRPRADLRGELEENQPRVEINIEVPKPPRGAWAQQAPDDAPADEPPPPPSTEAKP